ncbi:DASS family sodium-coupled anion symporter [Candidatus Midichloria mitochondrii]|nr:DASS family sodium-coupled anion symporter [Candidatus Midichloria mitochondrii]MDJ1299131.1 anion permease [Candidatus Midichloria mitochondrii]
MGLAIIFMLNLKTGSLKLALIFFMGAILFVMPASEGLSVKSWNLLIIFSATVAGAILNPMPMGVLVMLSILVSLLTDTLTLTQAFSGFGSYMVWLVVFAFFISRAIIKSNLGKRIAYYFIAKLGHNIIGLSYGLIFTELFLAPFIPSASARGGAVIFPVAQALTDQYNFVSAGKHDTKIRQFLMQLCFQANVITSSMFFTAMAGNPLISGLASGIGIDLSITNWALGAIVPGICALLILPFIIKFVIKPHVNNMVHAPILAQTVLKDMGPFSRNEIMVLITFAVLIILWVGGSSFGVDATTTALLGFIVLLLTGVITWDDAMNEKEAWRTFIWFAGFVMLSKFLSEMGVTKWIGDNIEEALSSYNATFAIPILLILFFYMHYFFASITVYASVMYVTFAMLLIAFGVPPLATALVLAVLANLSACLTHYGTTSAPIFFGSSHMSVKSWWAAGFIIGVFHLLIWSTIGVCWLETLGWL